MNKFPQATLLALTAMVASHAQAQDAEFHPLGDLPGGGFKSAALAVSDDGRTVAGRGTDGSVDTLTGFLWSQESGIAPLGDTSGGTVAYMLNPDSMSPDGQFVVGRIRDLQNGQSVVFRWTKASGFMELQSPVEYTRNLAWGVSADGRVVTGSIATDDFEKERAFRWTEQSGITDLGLLNDGDAFSQAYGISDDGKVIVGESHPPGTVGEAFRWTESEGMVGLGFLEGGGRSRARDASKDGSVIVGSSDSGSGDLDWEAFHWTEGQGMTTLGSYPPNIVESSADAVSASGHVIAGSWAVPNPDTISGSDSHAMIWTPSTGPVELQEALMNGGATGLEGWILETLSDVSGNGQWVVGKGINPEGNEEAFLARLSSDIVPRFQINPGMNDAWYNPATNGQGFFITAFPDIQQMFLAWFTYDTERPPEDVQAILGEPGHRWLTAQGPYSGSRADLTIFLTEGGLFDSVESEASADPNGYGSMTINFADCSEALVTYEIPSSGLAGEIPIERIANDNVELCQQLSSQ